MVALDSITASKVRFHLMYNAATPAGDRASVEKSMNGIPDVWTRDKIVELVARCERSFAQTELIGGQPIVNERIAVSGDVVRTTDSLERESWNTRQRYYLVETNMLAKALGVRNYRDEESAMAAFYVDGGTYINSIPGAKGDTGQVSAANGLVLNWSNAPPTGINQTAIFVDITDGILKKRLPSNGTIEVV